MLGLHSTFPGRQVIMNPPHASPHPSPDPPPHCATLDANDVTSRHEVLKCERCLRRDAHLSSPKGSGRHSQVFVVAEHPAAPEVERNYASGTGQVQAHHLDVSHPHPISTRLPGCNSNLPALTLRLKTTKAAQCSPPPCCILDVSLHACRRLVDYPLPTGCKTMPLHSGKV